jgi:hypothetical protein
MSDTIALIAETFRAKWALVRGNAKMEIVVMIFEVPTAAKCFLAQVAITCDVCQTGSW